MEIPQCSAKGCRAPARHVLLWNNPKLHTPDREKPWHACDEHLQHLSEYLGVRGFLLRVEPLAGAPVSRGLLPEATVEAPEDPSVPG